MTASRKRLAVVHIAKSRLGLSEEEYRNVMRHVGGVESSRDLDDTGFHLVMEHFRRLGFESTWRGLNYGDRAFMASPGQVALIRHLWAEYTDDQGDDLSLGKWLGHTFNVSARRFVTVELAPKVITALKAMTARKTGAGGQPVERPDSHAHT